MASPGRADAPADYRDRFEVLTGRSLRECPRCRTGTMVVIECIARLKICQPIPDTSWRGSTFHSHETEPPVA
jgi:hypothetical protein